MGVSVKHEANDPVILQAPILKRLKTECRMTRNIHITAA